MTSSALALLAGLVLLVVGAFALVRGAASLALRLGLSPLVVGLTVVAFGTSAPELVVSAGAAARGAGGIAIGNVVGSNIANIGLILGLAAVIRPVMIESSLLRRDLPLMILATILASAFLFDGTLERTEGALLALGLAGYLIATVRLARSGAVAVETDDLPVPSGPAWVDPGLVALGLALLVAGAELMVGGAVQIATSLGVSNAIIGLTIIGVGTSLPELSTSVVATIRGHSGIAAGNVVGSNLFNALGILGLSGVVSPLYAPGLTTADVIVFLASALVLVPIMRTGRSVSRFEGAGLLLAYGAYLGYLASTA